MAESVAHVILPVKSSMSFEVHTEVCSTHLRVMVSGVFQRDGLVALVARVSDLAFHAGRDRVLVDLRAVRGRPAELDRFAAGVKIAELAAPGSRIAVLARQEIINHFGEDAAVNRGAAMRVLAEEREALDWLGVGPD